MNSIGYQINQQASWWRSVLLIMGLLLMVVSYAIYFLQPLRDAHARIQAKIADVSHVIQLAQSQHFDPTQFVAKADLTDVHTLSAQLHDTATQWPGVQVNSVQTIRRQPITAVEHTDSVNALTEKTVYMRDVELSITGDAHALLQYLHTLENAGDMPIFWQSVAYHAAVYPAAYARLVLRIMESA